jgi:heterodisulfide reductase subunit D
MSYGIPQAFVSILEKAGEDYTTLGSEEWCCGYPLLIGGQVKAAESVIRHNVDVVRSLGVKRVVMTCPSCYHSWHHVYPQIVGELGFEVIHATEWMAEALEQGRLPLKMGRPMVVTYHDPCDLGRKGGIYDAPRKVLQAIPGVDLVEMDSRRETSLCCGGGGNLETFDPDLGAEVASKRIGEAQVVGAQVIASACPQSRAHPRHGRGPVGGAGPGVAGLCSKTTGLVVELRRIHSGYVVESVLTPQAVGTLC